MTKDQVIKTISASIRPQSLWFLLYATLIVCGLFQAFVFTQRPTDKLSSMSLYLFFCGQFAWWNAAWSRCLLLVQDARAIRVPGVEKAAAASLVVAFIVVAIVPAALMAKFAGASFISALALDTDIVLAALLALILPKRLSLMGTIGLLGGALLWLLYCAGIVPGVRDAGFATFGWSLAAMLSGVSAWAWRRLFHSDLDSAAGRLETIFAGRRQLLIINAGGLGGANASTSRRTSRAIDLQLHRTQGNEPAPSLRLWLGGAFAPATIGTRFWQIASPTLGAVFVGIVISLLTSRAEGAREFGMFLSVMLCLQGTVLLLPPLERLFCRKNTELELLALLPTGADAKRTVLAAVFQPLLGLSAAQALPGLIALFSLQATSWAAHARNAVAELGLVIVFAIAATVVCALRSLVGRPTPKIVSFLFYTGLVEIGIVVQFFPFSTIWANAAVVGLLLALAVLLVWSGISAWREFQRRPHPFLLNS